MAQEWRWSTLQTTVVLVGVSRPGGHLRVGNSSELQALDSNYLHASAYRAGVFVSRTVQYSASFHSRLAHGHLLRVVIRQPLDR